MQKEDVKSGEVAETMIEEMFRAGAHYGYSKTRRHPSVAKYIYGTKNKQDLIDLQMSAAMLERAGEFAKSLGMAGKVILFVGTKPEAKGTVKSMAETVNAPYVSERWIGGTLTNWGEIKKRISELENYQKESAEGGLEKYTKKERLILGKKVDKLAKYYTGLLALKKAPDALFIIDAKAEHIAEREAKDMNIPIIALLNSDSDTKSIQYPIVANDSSIPSIKFFASKIAEAYQAGLNTVGNPNPSAENKTENKT